MAHRIHLGHFRQKRRHFTHQVLGNIPYFRSFCRQLRVIAPTRAGMLKYQHDKSESLRVFIERLLYFTWRPAERAACIDIKDIFAALLLRYPKTSDWFCKAAR
jgi:hypothetical protein